MRGLIDERRVLITTTRLFTGVRETYGYVAKGSSSLQAGHAVGVLVRRTTDDAGEQAVTLLLLVPDRPGTPRREHIRSYPIEALVDAPDDVQAFLEQYAPEALQHDDVAI